MCDRWQHYSSLLDECEDYLNDDVFPWIQTQEQMHSSETQATAHTNLEHARVSGRVLLQGIVGRRLG